MESAVPASANAQFARETGKEGSMLRQPRAVWAIFFACMIAFMGLGLVDPILPAIAVNLHATKSQVTLLFTSYNAVMAVSMLVTGAVSSRIGIKRTLLSGIVIIAMFSAFGGLSNGIWPLVGLRGGWGLGNALFVATSLAAIVSLSNTGPAKSVILYEAAIGLGISVGPLIGGFLGGISWRGPFLGVASLMVIAFIGLVAWMPKQKMLGAPQRSVSLVDPFRAMRHRALVVFGVSAALYNFGFFTVLAYSPFVMGLNVHGLGYVFLCWGVFLAITSVFMAPKLQKTMGTIKAMMLMLSLFGLLLLAIGIWTSLHWVVIFAVIIAGGVLGNNNTLITTAVMNSAPVERSTASAAYSFLRFLGAAIAPYTAGQLAEWFNPHVPFFTGAAFVFMSVLFIAINYRHIRHVDEVLPGH